MHHLTCFIIFFTFITTINCYKIINCKLHGKHLSMNSNIDEMKDIPVSKSTSPEGYLSSDISSLSDGKQTRVALYIAVALLPCLLLIPFYMSRDFIPPNIN